MNESSRDFVKRIEEMCEPMFFKAENDVKWFFDQNPSKDLLKEYFVGRMINERVNCTEIAKNIAKINDDISPEDLFLLSKQVMDEAKHFRLVKEVVEFITGEDVDLGATMYEYREKAKVVKKEINEGRGLPAALLDKYESSKDEVVQAIYQFVGEGRAARNWAMMAVCAPESYIRDRYKEIAKDERFHAKIGRNALIKLAEDVSLRPRIEAVAKQFIEDLYGMGCMKKHFPLSALED